MTKDKQQQKKADKTRAEKQRAIMTRYWVKRVLNMSCDEIKAILFK